jgi:hypothetical protein
MSEAGLCLRPRLQALAATEDRLDEVVQEFGQVLEATQVNEATAIGSIQEELEKLQAAVAEVVPLRQVMSPWQGGCGWCSAREGGRRWGAAVHWAHLGRGDREWGGGERRGAPASSLRGRDGA